MFPILTYIYSCINHVIIKEIHPTAYHPDEVLSEQVPEEHRARINGEQVNDHIEEDDHSNNIVEDDGTNTLIHDSFNVKIDNDDDDDNDDGDHDHDDDQ